MEKRPIGKEKEDWEWAITLSNGIVTPTHRMNMRESLWLFIWLLNRVTFIKDNGDGIVLGGRPIKHKDVYPDLVCNRYEYRMWVQKLLSGGYIRTVRTPQGMSIIVTKAKKRFGLRFYRSENGGKLHEVSLEDSTQNQTSVVPESEHHIVPESEHQSYPKSNISHAQKRTSHRTHNQTSVVPKNEHHTQKQQNSDVRNPNITTPSDVRNPNITTKVMFEIQTSNIDSISKRDSNRRDIKKLTLGASPLKRVEQTGKIILTSNENGKEKMVNSKNEILENEIQKVDNNNPLPDPTSPSGSTGEADASSESTKTHPETTLVNDTIALFLPILPGDFVGKSSAFAKPPTRDAVKALLKSHGFSRIKSMISQYAERITDPYRPEVGTVYEFCTYKLAKIDAYLAKAPKNQTWQQRSFETPTAKARKEEIINQIAERAKEENRRRKEEWERNHPNPGTK